MWETKPSSIFTHQGALPPKVSAAPVAAHNQSKLQESNVFWLWRADPIVNMTICFCGKEYHGNMNTCPVCTAPNPDKGTPRKGKQDPPLPNMEEQKAGGSAENKSETLLLAETMRATLEA